jgi:2-oxoglutarate ferredoxin oxidoreductase subunit alpha
MLILTWGSTFGPGRVAAERLHKENIKASHVHLRYMNPLPIDLDGILKKFKHILIPEINMGQLSTIIRAKYLVEAEGLNVVRGRPIRASVIVSRVKKTLGI